MARLINFFYFIYQAVGASFFHDSFILSLSIQLANKLLSMSGFKPGTSGVNSECSPNCAATTTAQTELRRWHG